MTIILPRADRLESVLPPKYDSNLIWHYTDTAGTLGIVSDNAIRASSIWSLNDSGEFAHGVALIRERWDAERGSFTNHKEVAPLLAFVENRLQLEDTFVACASKAGHSLSQWRSYGSYAIGINPATRLQVRGSDSPARPIQQWTEELGQTQVAVETGWREVLYDDDEKLAHIRKLFIELDKLVPLCRGDFSEESRTSFRLASDLYFCTVAFLKHPAFEDEQEVRLVARYDSQLPGVRLRAGRFGIVPYLLIETAQDLIEEEFPELAYASHTPKKLPVLQVKIGPGLADPEAALKGLKMALRLKGFEIEPTAVDIPFR